LNIPNNYEEDILEINNRLDSYEEDIENINSQLDNLSVPDYSSQINNINNTLVSNGNMINQIMVNELPHIKSDIQFINEI
jgi:hypothetical protein